MGGIFDWALLCFLNQSISLSFCAHRIFTFEAVIFAEARSPYSRLVQTLLTARSSLTSSTTVSSRPSLSPRYYLIVILFSIPRVSTRSQIRQEEGERSSSPSHPFFTFADLFKRTLTPKWCTFTRTTSGLRIWWWGRSPTSPRTGELSNWRNTRLTKLIKEMTLGSCKSVIDLWDMGEIEKYYSAVLFTE